MSHTEVEEGRKTPKKLEALKAIISGAGTLLLAMVPRISQISSKGESFILNERTVITEKFVRSLFRSGL